jgi:hypothetical protein
MGAAELAADQAGSGRVHDRKGRRVSAGKRVREEIPEQLEQAGAKSLALGYGITLGAL